MARLAENKNIVYVLKPADHQAGADGDSFHAGRMHHFTFLIQFGVLTGNAILKVFSGATAGTKTTAETFNHRLADAVQGGAAADTFADWATSAALTLTAATYQNKMLVVEMDSDELTVAQPWVTLEFGAEATALNASIAAVGDSRFKALDIPTVIA